MKDLKSIKIGRCTINYGLPCFIIAEAGVNHNGDLEIGLKLIDKAAEARVNAVKFQTFKAENLVTKNAAMAYYQKKILKSGKSQYKMLKKLELDKKEHSILKKYAEKRGLVFLSTAHSGEEDVRMLRKLGVDAYKIGSGDLNNKPFIKYVAKDNKPMIIGTGMATMEEVNNAIRWINEEGNSKIIMLHCTTNYPCPYNEVNMNAMTTMIRQKKSLVGYSDHTMGIAVPIMARVMGACVIEKHFTLNRKMKGPDHAASLEPEELRTMVQSIRNIEQSFGSYEKKPSKGEKENMKAVRKSLVASRNLKINHIIDHKDVVVKRPGTGLQPKDIYKVIGKKILQPIKKDEIINLKKLS